MRIKRVLALTLAVLFAIGLAGCSKLTTAPGGWFSRDKNTAAVPASAPAEINIQEAEPVGPTETVELYFVDQTKKKLVSEKRRVPKVVGIARATVEELLKGPAAESGLAPGVPAGTSLLDISVRNDGLCTVDLSKEYRAKTLDTMAETMAVYSVVDTLTQFPTIKRVQILVNGQKIDTLSGRVIISDPLARDSSLISK
ncbi:MAG: GerMN domain-containing protein [Firmicutes bacterium]|nr:GerMN domain-containing protein [Bacillota bacterium]